MTNINPTYLSLIQSATGLNPKSIRNTVQLLEEGATVPFIARYRKEMTGSLDEVEITDIQKQYKKLQELDKRKETILKAIEEQDKLTDELRQRIENCYDSTELEDIYLPYKRKRRTRATKAKEKGLEPLALQILQQPRQFDPEISANDFVNEAVPDVAEALQGARDIIAEIVNEDEQARNTIRKSFQKEAMIYARVARGKEQEGAKYKDYFDYTEALKNVPSHRLLALRRGEEEGILRVLISPDDEQAIDRLERLFVQNSSPASKQVQLAVEDAYKRLLAPSIETEFRNLSKEKADQEAILVFADNLRQLLLSAPLGQKTVIGLDPGFRTGCKVVVLNKSGDLLENTTIYPHPPQKQVTQSAQTLQYLAQKHQVEAIAVGNGTASRETMDHCRSIDFGRNIELFLVNEAGASIYSASEIAREEFPDHDVTVRGAVSIGRRLMDPLAELVKIDPKSIGVGQYQHDVSQPLLRDSLTQVVESCVNSVGININTASKHLLTYVSGLGPALAQNIVQYRSENGPFQSRRELLKVPRMGDKAYEQAAGFLRIRGARHPLDNTAVHPESYHIVERMAKDLNSSVEELIKNPFLRKQIDLHKYTSDAVGLPTLKDIMQELEKPGLDPRGKAQTFEFADIRSIEDLYEGMIVPGIVNNITNFGAFVDIGIKESGLVHISQLANRFVKSPAEVVQLNQKVQVKVMSIDLDRKRIQLSMKEV